MLDESNDRAIFEIGNVFVKRGEFDKALEQYKHALELNSAQNKKVIEKVNALISVNKLDEANIILNLFVEYEPDVVDVLISRAKMMIEENKIDESKILLDKILELEPNNETANQLNLGLKDKQKKN